MRLLVKLAMLLLVVAPARADERAATPDVYRRIAGEAEASLRRDVLEKWFPAAVDREAGGFHENFGEDWSRGAGGEKSIVYQSRLTWLLAQAAVRFPEKSAEYL